MNHAMTPAYLKAHAAAAQEVKDGHALSYLTGYSRETGRYIELQTDQGWNPEPFWQEHRAEYSGESEAAGL